MTYLIYTFFQNSIIHPLFDFDSMLGLSFEEGDPKLERPKGQKKITSSRNEIGPDSKLGSKSKHHQQQSCK